MCVCMCVCVCMWVSVCVYACVCVRSCVCVCARVLPHLTKQIHIEPRQVYVDFFLPSTHAIFVTSYFMLSCKKSSIRKKKIFRIFLYELQPGSGPICRIESAHFLTILIGLYSIHIPYLITSPLPRGPHYLSSRK